MASTLKSDEKEVKKSIDLSQIQNNIDECELNAKSFEEAGNPLEEFKYLSQASSLLQLILESDVLTEGDRKSTEENFQKKSDKLYNLQSEMGLVIAFHSFDCYQDQPGQSAPNLGTEAIKGSGEVSGEGTGENSDEGTDEDTDDGSDEYTDNNSDTILQKQTNLIEKHTTLLEKQTTLLERQTTLLEVILSATCSESPGNPASNVVGSSKIESFENQSLNNESEVKSSATDFDFTAVKIDKPVKVIGHKNLIDTIISAIKTQDSQPEYYPNFQKFTDRAFLLYGCAGKVIAYKSLGDLFLLNKIRELGQLGQLGSSALMDFLYF